MEAAPTLTNAVCVADQGLFLRRVIAMATSLTSAVFAVVQAFLLATATVSETSLTSAAYAAATAAPVPEAARIQALATTTHLR